MSHTDSSKSARFFRWLSEYSIPLILGVVCALFLANTSPELYRSLVHTPVTDLWQSSATEEASTVHHDPHSDSEHSMAHHAVDHQQPTESATATHAHATHAGRSHADTTHAAVAPTETAHTTPTHASGSHAGDSHDDHSGHSSHGGHDLSHYFTLHFLINDIFMVFFFGVAAKEITEACLPNGALNPVKKAINPLFATVGGILGPVAVYLGVNAVMGQASWTNGWGIPTATDIALAWLVAKLIFGDRHPAISFLLLLAVADDAIGLVIIAIAYPDPNHPAEWANLWWILPGMAAAYGFRRFKVKGWIPYILVGGSLSWWGLFSAHLHPALALVFIVPFLPAHGFDMGLFVGATKDPHDTPLDNFEHDLRRFVDFGLFFFALANAGVEFSGVNGLTWLVVASLLVGKTVGVTAFSVVADKLGYPLAKGMEFRHLLVTAVISGLGLTVALFVSGQAFTDMALQDAAKMGAVFSASAAALAFVLAAALGLVRIPRLSFWNRTQHA